MTPQDMMTLQALLEKGSDADLPDEMIGFTAERLMALEVEGLAGAAHGDGGAEDPEAAQGERLAGVPRGFFCGAASSTAAAPCRATGAHQQADRRRGRTPGQEIPVIALALADHRHPCRRTGIGQFHSVVEALQPAPALPVLRSRLEAEVGVEMEQSQGTAALGEDDPGMGARTAARSLAPVCSGPTQG